MADPYYADDSVTLYLGDCLEIDAWRAADVLVTDPPYGQAYVSNEWGRGAGDKVVGDHDATARDAALALWAGPALVFGNWRVTRPPNLTNRLLWHKKGRQPGFIGASLVVAWYPVDEEIYVIGRGWVGPPVANVYATEEQRTLQPAKVGHPTPKPLGLMEQLLQRCPAGVVADPFAGAGATLIAARNLGRKAIGVEIEERYCETIAKRLAQDVLFADLPTTSDV